MKRFTITVLILFIGWVIIFLSGNNKKGNQHNSKSGWIKEYFEEIKSGKYPEIHAISWWHEDYDNVFLTINSSDNSLEAYKEMIKDDVFITSCSFSNNKLMPIEGKIYHCAFPDFGGTEDIVTEAHIDDFESLAGQNIAWAYFSNNWMDGLIFPKQAVEIISAKGKVPFIRLMFRSVFEDNKPDPKYKLIDIINGKYDSAIISWANEAINCNTYLLAEFGTEVNGRWFPWNGYHNGGGRTDGYGDENYPDGPEIFRDAYRHIIDLCNKQGCENITWFFHIDASDDPEEWWNSSEYYYPGDDYIDWIGISTYGPFQQYDEYISPKELLKNAYNKMKTVSINKAYAILEFGITELYD